MAFSSAPKFPEEKSKGDSKKTPAKVYAETLIYSRPGSVTPLSSSAIPYVNAPIGGNSGTTHYLSFSSGNYPGLRPHLSSSITSAAGYPSFSSKANRTNPKEAEAKAPFLNETSAKSSELKEVSSGKNASPPFADNSPHINSQDGKSNPEGQDERPLFRIGEKVMARYKPQTYKPQTENAKTYRGAIKGINPRGEGKDQTYEILYDDGDQWLECPERHIFEITNAVRTRQITHASENMKSIFGLSGSFGSSGSSNGLASESRDDDQNFCMGVVCDDHASENVKSHPHIRVPNKVTLITLITLIRWVLSSSHHYYQQ
jgi:hypothetical protein